jgi:hypothetical protein
VLCFGGALVVTHHDHLSGIVVAAHALSAAHACQVSAQICALLLLAFVLNLVLACLFFGFGGFGPALAEGLFLLRVGLADGRPWGALGSRRSRCQRRLT